MSTLLFALLGAAVLPCGCDGGRSPVSRSEVGGSALVGEEPVPMVHLFENHSSALTAWRKAGVRDRILVHLDAHADLDWLPDETVARIAAADPGELAALELHPYALDRRVYERFSIWNFLYPASRLGLIRELVWVVPDGSISDPISASRFVREILMDRIERFSLREVSELRLQGGVLQGEILGLPTTICELAELPLIEEPVLLDVDLDYFTTKSALSMYVTENPWIQPGSVVSVLREKGLRTDLATISLSTIGGYVPPLHRWMGYYLQARLHTPEDAPAHTEVLRQKAMEQMRLGNAAGAVKLYRELLRIEREDPCGWYGLAIALEKAARGDEAVEARARAVSLDPLMAHDLLFQADRMWFNEEHETAQFLYSEYLESDSAGRFRVHALRRKGECLVALGRHREALAVFGEVDALVPDHAETLLDAGLLFREMNVPNRALGLLSRARALLPMRSTYALALGNTLVMAGYVAQGAEELKMAVAMKPCSVEARTSLADALTRINREKEASEHVRVALRLDPNCITARRLAVRLRQDQGESRLLEIPAGGE